MKKLVIIFVFIISCICSNAQFVYYTHYDKNKNNYQVLELDTLNERFVFRGCVCNCIRDYSHVASKNACIYTEYYGKLSVEYYGFYLHINSWFVARINRINRINNINTTDKKLSIKTNFIGKEKDESKSRLWLTCRYKPDNKKDTLSYGGASDDFELSPFYNYVYPFPLVKTPKGINYKLFPKKIRKRIKRYKNRIKDNSNFYSTPYMGYSVEYDLYFRDL